MRAALAVVLAAALAISCRSGGKDARRRRTDADVQQRLAQLDHEIADSGRFGMKAGALLERRAELCERVGRVDEAIHGYEDAARAYSQGPDDSNMPALLAERAQGKADKLKLAPAPFKVQKP